MNGQHSTIVPSHIRLLVAGIAPLLALIFLNGPLATQAKQAPAAQKKPADETSKDDQSEVPPPKVVEENDWLTTEAFDRLRLSVELPDRQNMIGRLDKNPRDGKLSKEEWPDSIPYKFESFDWNGDGFVDDKELIGVIVDVEPLDPRPFPLKKVGDEQLELKVRIRLATGEHLEWEVMRNRIVEVKYFEDFLLDQARKWILKLDLNRAFDFIYFTMNRQPKWNGLDGVMVEFWYREAEAKLLELQEEKALNILHEMMQYCKQEGIPEHPRTKDKMGQALNNIVERAIEQKNYQMGRHSLFKLEADYPGHPLAKQLREKFIQGTDAVPGAERLRQQAKIKEAAGQLRDACYLMLQAADIWPALPGLDEDFKRIFEKYPILLVAVRELPDRFAPWAPPGTPDSRVAQLLHIPLMEVAGVGENTQFSSRVLDEPPELAELGRRITLRIKPGLLWSDGERPITASDVTRSLNARLDKSLPSFDAALNSIVKTYDDTGPYEVVVDLHRTQLRPQTNFLFNVAAGHRLIGDRFDQNAAVGAGPFRFLTKKTGTEVSLRANKNFFAGQPKIAEIVERRYPTGKDGVKALLAGDVAMLGHVPPKELKRIEARTEDMAVGRGIVPAVHVISFDFRTSAALKDQWALRRAMVYAIDRKKILEDGILDGQPCEGDELIHGPFPKGSFAFEPSIEPWPYNAVLAKGLVDAAKKDLNTKTLRFTLHHPDTEEVREACKFIKTYWGIVGIEVDLKPLPTQELEELVALGRRFELVYRIHYVRDPVLDAARVLNLGPPISPQGVMPNAATAWERQNLRDLEFATNWPLARAKLQLLQHQARDDVAIIPLWQLTDYYAYHKRLKGVLDASLGLYQDAESWQVEPWYRTDPK